MKIAYCMSGCIGGLSGKAGDKTDGSDQVLKISADQFYNKIRCNENDTIDIFIFSWDTHLHDEYEKIYKPKLILTQEQIKFDISSENNNYRPSLIWNRDYVTLDNSFENEKKRLQSHYSRWYSVKKVVELKNNYELKNGLYDLTILTRLDMYWIKHLNLSLLDPNFINLDQCIFHGKLYGSKQSKELGDRFIASNSENINKISTIYDKLDEYKKKIQMYRNISSHFIIPHHLNQNNLRDKVSFPFMYYTPSYDQKYEDSHCTLVRYRK